MSKNKPAAEQPYVPDEIDRQLIRMLSEDGRTPYSDLARQVSLSETRVRARVNRLVQEEFLHIKGIPNLIKLGADQIAMVGIRCSENIEETAEILSEDEQVTFLAICAGSYDIMIEVVCRSKEALLRLIQDIRSLRGVKDTETFMYLQTPKTLYAANPGALPFSR